MNYRELTIDELWEAVSHLGYLHIDELELDGETDFDPEELLRGLGVDAPTKQDDPLSFLISEDEDDYSWAELMNAIIPPVVVVDGVLADGFHRCRLCCVLGISVKAVTYSRTRK
jgi:hypothetical protein